MTNDRRITISHGSSRRSTNWQPQTLMLSELYGKLKTPARGKETLAEYMQLKKARQDDLKDVGGFVAGTLNGPRRKANNVTGRDVITLDLDNYRQEAQRTSCGAWKGLRAATACTAHGNITGPPRASASCSRSTEPSQRTNTNPAPARWLST